MDALRPGTIRAPTGSGAGPCVPSRPPRATHLIATPATGSQTEASKSAVWCPVRVVLVMATVAEEEYLERIYWLMEAELPITGANIARAMQVSAPTVHEM